MPHHVDHQGRDGDHHRHHRRASRSPHQKNPEFRFSIEMGLLVRSRQIDHKTVQGLQKELSTRLTIAGVTNQHIAVTNGQESFKDWTISASLAISSKPKEHKFGLRLVSPFMPFAWFDVWKAQIRTVLHVLNTDFETTATHQCSTHIHLVPIKGYWRLSQAISLAKSAIYFEPCLDRLMPLYRRKCVWAKSNRWNKYLGKYTLPDCFDRLSAQDTFEGLAARMSWTSKDSPSGRALGHQTDFTHDAYRWNFSPAGDTSGYGQIEFRQPPGITESSDMISWITLVVLFAQVSINSADTIIRPSKPAQLSKLADLIYAQAAETRVPKGRVSLLKNTIFEQANPPPAQAKPTDAVMALHAGNPDPKDITIDEDQRLRWVNKEGGGVGNTIARAKYWSLLEDLRPPGRDGMMVVTPHW